MSATNSERSEWELIGMTMELQAYQQRVVTEKAELDERMDKLTDFIDSPIFAGLQEDEQERIVRQLHYMGHYTAVLGERIAAFGG